MKKEQFNDNEEAELVKACVYCEKATSLATDGDHMLCKKRGIVECSYSCRKFSYDPLKRKPMQPKITHLDPSVLDLN